MTSHNQNDTSTANNDFEKTLWAMTNKMRGHMDPSEYKHVVLGLIFLKYISDAFKERYTELAAKGRGDEEEISQYPAENVFWVPKIARWDNIQDSVGKAYIGKVIDDAMVAIEKDNEHLKDILPKDYSRSALNKQKLGELVDLISSVSMKNSVKKDILGSVYEYFLSQFASTEGKGGGEFYTPESVVQLLVEMLEPYKGRVYDPCCGSGGMFVQSEKFIEKHGDRIDDISVYGQESNETTRRLCKMNLAIRGIKADLGSINADTFHANLHKDLQADFIMANPPFNISEWGGERLSGDIRWKYGVPPSGNANYAWIQHIVHHLKPDGFAGIVLANGSMSSTTGGEGEIRRKLIEDDMIDCMVSLPTQLFYSTQIPVCLWFLAKDRSNGKIKDSKLRDRRGEILFIDARKLGFMADRTHRDFHQQKDTDYITSAYHAWRGGKAVTHEAFPNRLYQDIPGFCKSATLAEIKEQDYVLTPGRYVGAEAQVEDTEPFDDKMTRLIEQLKDQFTKSTLLDDKIKKNLAGLSYEF
ncbi:MAG: type I restriction-modification system subunit M [Proteobacteria bacterium]|nr:type I restriction-modification system subunit M [Pseudomonadota bacterium]